MARTSNVGNHTNTRMIVVARPRPVLVFLLAILISWPFQTNYSVKVPYCNVGATNAQNITIYYIETRLKSAYHTCRFVLIGDENTQ